KHVFHLRLENLSDTDRYLGDNERSFPFRYLANDPITLPYSQNFESWQDIEVRERTYAMDSIGYWDFLPIQDKGRLRTSIFKDMAIEGSKSLSLDAWQSVEEQENAVLGQFNLSDFSIDQDEIRMDFRYLLHGEPKFPQDN